VVEALARARRQPARRRLPRPLRDAGVALASVGVVVLLVGYALAGPSIKLNASVGAIATRSGANALVYGRVLEPGGGGLSGARIDIRRAGRPVVAAVSDSTGSFRIELPGVCATYDISLRAVAQGSTMKRKWRRRLCQGNALPIDARVVTLGHFLWVPGPR
jgi:hypothetical protein